MRATHIYLVSAGGPRAPPVAHRKVHNSVLQWQALAAAPQLERMLASAQAATAPPGARPADCGA